VAGLVRRPAHIDDFGGSGRIAYTLMGETVNSAFRVESLLVAKKTRPAGPGSPPAAVSRTVSRNTASSSLRPISRTATAAHFRAWRERQQPTQMEAERTRSSSDFKAMPAAKAAAISSGSRPRGRVQLGKAAGSTGEATRGVTGEP